MQFKEKTVAQKTTTLFIVYPTVYFFNVHPHHSIPGVHSVLIREVLRRLEGGPIRSHSLSPLNTQYSVSLSLSSQSLVSMYPPPPPISLSFSVLFARPLCLPICLSLNLTLANSLILTAQCTYSQSPRSPCLSLSIYLLFPSLYLSPSYSISTYFSLSL